MLSAFGIDHGGVSKSATKVVRNLQRSGVSWYPKKGDTFQGRMKTNYFQARDKAKFLGKKEANPNKWKKHDAETAAWTEKEYGKKGWKPDPRVVAAREKNRLRAIEDGKTMKEFSRASVEAHSANARRTRKLP